MVKDSHLTGRTEVGQARFSLQDLGPDGKMSGWLKLDPVGPAGPQGQPSGEMLVEIAYKVRGSPFHRTTSSSFPLESVSVQQTW